MLQAPQKMSARYSLNSRFAFVDVETTGSIHPHGRIMEIGVLVVENQKIVETYKTLIDPETSFIPHFISQLTGIRSSDLVGAPTFHSIHRKLLKMLEGAIFVAHNARFDYGFIASEFKRHGVDFSAPTLCSVKLSRAFFPQFKRHNLDAVTDRIGINVKNRHRAFDDAEAIWKFFCHLANNFEREKIDRKIHELST